MANAVTVLGSQGKTITLNYDTSSNVNLARELAGQITAGIQALRIVAVSDTTVPLPTMPHGVTGEYVQEYSGITMLPKGYAAYVTTAPTAVVFGSGDQNESILSGDTTNLTFIAASGSGTVAAGGGTDRIMIGAGNRGDWSLNTGNGNDVILALGSGNDTISAGGGHNAISLGTGSNLVVSTGDDTIVASGGTHLTGSGNDDRHGSGGDSDRDDIPSRPNTIDASGASSDIVYGGSSDLVFVGGFGGATIFGGSGSDTYFGGTGGSQAIHGGTSGNNFLFAGTGAATLFGGGNGDQLFAYGNQNQTLIAGFGQETLSAAFSSGNDLLIAGSGNVSLIGGSGADTFVGGSGHDTVFAANPGAALFEFIKGQAGGTELVENVFGAADVHIHLSGYAANEVTHALASQHAHDGGVILSLSDGTKVTFENVTRLTSSNFV